MMDTLAHEGALIGGRFKLVAPLGAGAQGSVWSAEDLQAGAPAAVKLSVEGALFAEAAMLLRVAHRVLPRVLGLGRTESGGAWLAMERVDGLPLDAYHDLATVGRAVADAASGLAALHDLGLVHRDVKPAHIVLSTRGARLLDLGLASSIEARDTVAGALAFLPPEALAGQLSAAADVYALGVSAVLTLTGEHPVLTAPDDPDAVRAALAEMRLRDEVMAALPARLRGVLAEAVAPDPAQRIRSMRAFRARWMRALDLEDDTPDAGFAADPVWVGDAETRRALTEALARADRGAVVGVAVAGSAGSGRDRVIDDALRALEVRLAARGEGLTRVTDAAALGAVTGRFVWRLCDPSPEALKAAAAAVEGLQRFAAQRGFVLAAVTEAPDDPRWAACALGPLDREGVATLLSAMLGSPVADPVSSRWHAATGGRAGAIVRAARALGPGRIVSADAATLRSAARADGVALGAGLSPQARRLAAVLESADSALPMRLLVALDPGHEGVAELRAAGLLLGDAEALSLSASLSLGAETEAIEQALVVAESVGFSDAAVLARWATRAGHRDWAWALWANRLEASAGDARALARAWHEARAVAPDPHEAALVEARWWLVCGESERCLAALEGAAEGAAARALRVDALRRSGRRAEALAEAEALASHEDAASETLGRLCLARVALDRAALGEVAERVREAELDGEVSPLLRSRALELGALVARARGQTDLAQRRALAYDEATRGDALSGNRARALSLRGMLAHEAGHPGEAAAHFREAWGLASQLGDAHAAATYEVNLGAASLEAGRLGEALGAMSSALKSLAAQGRLPELSRALANLASLRAWLGDTAAAERLARRAAEAAREVGDAVAACFAEAIEAECVDSPDESAARLGALAAQLAAHGETARAAECLARAARRALGAEQTQAADAWVLRARRLAGEQSVALVSAAALALAAQRHDRSVGERVDRQLVTELDDDPSLEARLWRLGSLARLAQGESERLEERAFRALDALLRELSESLPEAERALFLKAHSVQREVLRVPNDRRGDPTVWRRLAAITRSLQTETRVDLLLARTLDAALELTGGRRGFVLLADEAGGLRIRAARNVTHTDLAGDELSFSRSVAERVARSGQSLVTVDAQTDGRLGAAESVAAMQLRSVLAVPLRLSNETVGAVYVDDRFRVGAFDQEAVAVTEAFADAAALCLHHARQRHALERALHRAEKLSEALARTVETQRVELAVARESSAPDKTRGRYDALIGRGPAMRAMLALIDRVAPTAMPVLLQGESGTGKELVARAIHDNSPRGGRAFVAENCSAIPESLLESVLFGHVKGAFTGADRARPGLFEVADGGTLFLDEVGEMSPAMQSRLLRVLQEGEVRPVGGDRTRKVDVRVLAATHRDLAEMVRRGTFREDLFYRLAVVVLPVPALRVRREDIAALVSHFLARQSPGTGIDKQALGLLVDAPWPGNVRQLQNEIARAAVLADGVIHAQHLSPTLRGADGAPHAPDNPLDLKHAVDHIERDLVERALREHHGNQSQAARALGMSRFGLQKKLKRLGIDPHALTHRITPGRA